MSNKFRCYVPLAYNVILYLRRKNEDSEKFAIFVSKQKQ